MYFECTMKQQHCIRNRKNGIDVKPSLDEVNVRLSFLKIQTVIEYDLKLLQIEIQHYIASCSQVNSQQFLIRCWTFDIILRMTCESFSFSLSLSHFLSLCRFPNKYKHFCMTFSIYEKLFQKCTQIEISQKLVRRRRKKYIINKTHTIRHLDFIKVVDCRHCN